MTFLARNEITFSSIVNKVQLVPAINAWEGEGGGEGTKVTSAKSALTLSRLTLFYPKNFKSCLVILLYEFLITLYMVELQQTTALSHLKEIAFTRSQKKVTLRESRYTFLNRFYCK